MKITLHFIFILLCGASNGFVKVLKYGTKCWKEQRMERINIFTKICHNLSLIMNYLLLNYMLTPSRQLLCSKLTIESLEQGMKYVQS